MPVHVDQAWHKVVPGQVHDLCFIISFWTTIFVDRNSRIADCLNLRDAVFLYHNIHWT